MLNYPDVMKRCQAEIDDVLGQHREPSMKDKASLPYLESTLLEIQRMASIVPFGVCAPSWPVLFPLGYVVLHGLYCSLWGMWSIMASIVPFGVCGPSWPLLFPLGYVVLHGFSCSLWGMWSFCPFLESNWNQFFCLAQVLLKPIDSKVLIR